MPEPIKAVIDSNVLVSILKGSSRLSLLYTAFKDGRFILVLSAELVGELASVLYRPELKLDPRDIKELFRLLRTRSVRIKLPAPFIRVCRDPKDNFLLELAVVSKSNCVVTGDKDLLVLNPFRNIPIITPQEFLARLR